MVVIVLLFHKQRQGQVVLNLTAHVAPCNLLNRQSTFLPVNGYWQETSVKHYRSGHWPHPDCTRTHGRPGLARGGATWKKNKKKHTHGYMCQNKKGKWITNRVGREYSQKEITSAPSQTSLRVLKQLRVLQIMNFGFKGAVALATWRGCFVVCDWWCSVWTLQHYGVISAIHVKVQGSARFPRGTYYLIILLFHFYINKTQRRV